MKDALIMVAADRLHPNPDNPRKALGDLTELAASIKVNGVMQNLTVIPQEGKTGEYVIVMGHRRHAAAVQAGLKELPCRVVEKLERSDQVAVMLSENLQRSNLTPYEEGQGFQLMLDLGETEKSICEKTGFGKTTVRHRLNIAKLDQTVLQKRQEEESFQLNFSDLTALEKVPDIAKRNEILERAQDSRDLAFLAQRAVDDIKREENLAKAIVMLEKAGVKPAPDKVSTEIYSSSKWQVIEKIKLEDDLPDSYQPKQTGELFYYQSYREIKIIKRAEKKKAEKPKTEAEKKHQEQEAQRKRNRKQLLEAAKEVDAVCRDFILSAAGGKIAKPKAEDLTKAQNALWQILYDVGAVVSRSDCIAFRCNQDYYDVAPKEREVVGKWVDKLGMVYQMLILAYGKCKCTELVDSNGEYKAKTAERVKRLYAVLRTFGLHMEKETKLILDGKHELYYVKPAEKPIAIEDKASKTKADQKPAAKTTEPVTAGKAESAPGGKDAPGRKAKETKKPETGAKAKPKVKEQSKPQAETKAASKVGSGAKSSQELPADGKAAPVAEPVTKAAPQPTAGTKAVPVAESGAKTAQEPLADAKEEHAAKAETRPEMEAKSAETGKAEPEKTAALVEPGQAQKPAAGTKAA